MSRHVTSHNPYKSVAYGVGFVFSTRCVCAFTFKSLDFGSIDFPIPMLRQSMLTFIAYLFILMRLIKCLILFFSHFLCACGGNDNLDLKFYKILNMSMVDSFDANTALHGFIRIYWSTISCVI